MSMVEVSEQVLSWALNRANLTEDHLVNKFPKIHEWISGTKQPSLKQLERLAQTTRTPLGYFFLDEPPEESLPISHFRTLDDGMPSQPSPDLIETIHTMQSRQNWMRESFIERGQESLPFVGSVHMGEDPKTIVESMRHALGFEAGWAASYSNWSEALRALREAMDEIGILAVVNGVVGNNTNRRLSPDEFRGFVLVDEYAPLLFVNGRDSKAAQMFTLAHELAHVFFGSSAAFDLRGMQPAKDPMEKACNRVAAEFLVPESELRRIWPYVQSNPEPLQAVVYQFKVSTLVAARRALDLLLISKDQFFKFYNSYLDDERRVADGKESGGDFYVNQSLRVGRRFATEVANAAAEGRLLYSEAYDLTGLHGNTFHRYINLIGMDGV
ncbi:MAG: ImmA/IrrE family metallo-endopeptidase [Clostridia bacterium]|nr:ImmA/IrrE family metallo-endopeptidase [Clostridia bacterium]